MGWFDDAVRVVANPVGYAGQQIAGQQGRTMANVMSPQGFVADAVTGANRSPQGSASGNFGIQTPAQSAAARDEDIAVGQQRFRSMMANNAGVQDILRRRQEGLEGLNSQEMTAAKEGMYRGLMDQQKKATNALAANQASSGVRGGMAAAQQARLQRQIASDRAGQEQKMLVDNYAIKQNALDKYQQATMGQVYGELAQGLGEAGLGVSDRTGYIQALIGQNMATAAGQQPQRGLLGNIFAGLF